jgi:hypothetical protein
LGNNFLDWQGFPYMTFNLFPVWNKLH